MNNENPRYSFVIPVYNEEESLNELNIRLKDLMDNLDGDSEVILIDDGSTDESYSLMDKINQNDNRFKIIQFSRNFGHQFAITAGIDFSRGDAVIIMDADLQDDPDVCKSLIQEWKNGYEVVYAVRKKRVDEGIFKRVTAFLFYRFLRKLSRVDIPIDTGDFRLVDRKVIEIFKTLREHGRYVRGIFSWIGFKQKGIYYVRKSRYSGKTKFSFSKMFNFGISGIFSFSHAPLRIFLKFGIIISAMSFLCGISAIVLKILGLNLIPGWASIIVSIFFMGGVQLIIFGVIGEYIGYVYDEVKNRPLYIIRNTSGISQDKK